MAHVLDRIGLADRAKDPVENFSGGMKRRLNFGCGVVHHRAVSHARKHGVPLFVGSSFHDAPGTLISSVQPAAAAAGGDVCWHPLSIISHNDLALLEISELSAAPPGALASTVADHPPLAEWVRQDGAGLRWGVIGPSADISRLRDLLPDSGRIIFQRGLDGLSFAGPPAPSWLVVRAKIMSLLTEFGVADVHLIAVDGVLRLLLPPADAARVLQPLHDLFLGNHGKTQQNT